MPWFKVDDHFHSHPKVRRCGLEVVGLWTVSGSYCMAHLTDGFVEEWFVKEWRHGFKLAAALVAAGLWYETVRDGERGWQFHDWDKYQPTKKQVEAEREKARIRKANQRLSQGESHRDSRVDSGVESRQTSGTVPARPPDPLNNSLVDLGGELTQVEPQRFCPRHPIGTNDACGACADARRTHDAWTTSNQQNQLAQRRRIRQIRDDCPLCDDNGMLETPTGLTRCNHQAAAFHA